MASPQVVSVNWGDVVTTTLEGRAPNVADNVRNNNALFLQLKKKGEEFFEGGREIYQPLRYAENQSFMWYSGTEPVNVSHNDTMTAARFPLKQASISVVLSGLDQIQNSGDQAKLSLITQRVNSAMATIENQMSAAIYSDGTANGGKQIGGLALLISKVPSAGIVGGIDRSLASNAWWRNLAVNASTDSKGVVTQTNVVQYMNQITLALKRNGDGVDTIVADTNYYSAYLNNLQLIQRVTSESGSMGAGFTSLKYFGAGKQVDVILDGGRNGQIPTNTMYFINSEFFHYKPASERNWKVFGGDRTNINQDAIVRLLGWAGNVTVDNCQLHGVLSQ
jgi:hypothetical protein